MCWQHIQRWSFWSKRVIMQIASSSSMARFHYIFQRSQETSQQLKHFCITKTQSSEDLPAGFAIAIKDWSSKMICPGNSKGFRGETIRSYPLQCKQLTSGHIGALGSPVDPWEETKKKLPPKRVAFGLSLRPTSSSPSICEKVVSLPHINTWIQWINGGKRMKVHGSDRPLEIIWNWCLMTEEWLKTFLHRKLSQ